MDFGVGRLFYQLDAPDPEFMCLCGFSEAYNRKYHYCQNEGRSDINDVVVTPYDTSGCDSNCDK